MPHPTIVLNVVGLSRSLLGEHAPRLSAFAAEHHPRTLQPCLPAVTCSVQASMLTGLAPRDHGIVANGWYSRDLNEVHFWKQSNQLIRGEKVWETARRRDSSVTTANLFWWFNMNSSAEIAATPRPIYAADGRKIPDCLTTPAELRDHLQQRLGSFPLFKFWGPGADITSSQWIADAAFEVLERHRPTLTLVYLPHLDYPLQKLGPDHAENRRHVGDVDAIVGRFIEHCETSGSRLIILSEYGIEPVTDAVFINRALRDCGLLAVRRELDHEILEPSACRAFAVADHQIAHVYVRQAGDLAAAAECCRRLEGVADVLDRAGQAAAGIDHERSGDLVLIAAPGRWFTYDFWLDDSRAPDYARTVDIHRKPGYDPRELFVDPTISFPRLAIARRLLMKKLGFRTLMDVIPLDTRLVRGSHGRMDLPPSLHPLLMGSHVSADVPEAIPCTAVRDIMLRSLFDA